MTPSFIAHTNPGQSTYKCLQFAEIGSSEPRDLKGGKPNISKGCFEEAHRIPTRYSSEAVGAATWVRP